MTGRRYNLNLPHRGIIEAGLSDLPDPRSFLGLSSRVPFFAGIKRNVSNEHECSSLWMKPWLSQKFFSERLLASAKSYWSDPHAPAHVAPSQAHKHLLVPSCPEQPSSPAPQSADIFRTDAMSGQIGPLSLARVSAAPFPVPPCQTPRPSLTAARSPESALSFSLIQIRARYLKQFPQPSTHGFRNATRFNSSRIREIDRGPNTPDANRPHSPFEIYPPSGEPSR